MKAFLSLISTDYRISALEYEAIYDYILVIMSGWFSWVNDLLRSAIFSDKWFENLYNVRVLKLFFICSLSSFDYIALDYFLISLIPSSIKFEVSYSLDYNIKSITLSIRLSKVFTSTLAWLSLAFKVMLLPLEVAPGLFLLLKKL